MPVYPTVDATGIREAINALKKIDPDLVKALRSDLRSSLKPYAQQITQATPFLAPLSGMRHFGDTAYSPDAATVSLTTGKSRKFPTMSALVSIRVTPKNKKRGAYLAEFAGSRSSGYTASGRNMIAVLNQRKPMIGRGGRYAYDAFQRSQPAIFAVAINVIDKHIAQVNVRLSQ
jgi:hypothetical protein